MAGDDPEIERRVRAAITLQREGRLGEAEALYREAIGRQPDLGVARHNLVALLRAQHRWGEAEDALRAALLAVPGDPDLEYHLGLALLEAGDYEAGWPLFEARRRVSTLRVKAPDLPFPEWRGEPVGSLLLCAEQGFGDQIQFARYVRPLLARGIAVTLMVKPGLERLFEALGVPILSAVAGAVVASHDAWALVGSLPLRFGTTLDTIPDGRFVAGGQGATAGIGVVTRGRTTHPNDARRSLPEAAAQTLLALPGAVSLHPEDTGAPDFLATAEIVRRLAVVVTVDTSVAHLAGAMGKSVWILLPAVGADWRWLRERTDSPWYPSARLYRQQAGESWEPVTDAVKADLTTRIYPPTALVPRQPSL